MGRLGRKWIGIAVVTVVPCTAVAQLPFNLDASTITDAKADIGGTSAVDVITLRPIGPGAPLRFGGIVPKSERVTLDNEVLFAGTDYYMDYSTGVVYLKRAQRGGQTMIVSYRYTGKIDPAGSTRFNGLGTMKYTLGSSGLNLLMGFGATDREAGGGVAQSNVLGLHNNFGLGSGNLTGLMLFGSRDQATMASGLSMDRNAKFANDVQDSGQSRLALQNYAGSVLSGKLTLNYQNVSKKFSSFNSLAGAGLDDATITRLRSERGVTRSGAGIDGMKFGALGFSGGMKSVGDDKGGIEWKNFGITQGAYAFSMNSQRVNANFNHFHEIAEADREQLLKEKGLSRTNYAAKLGALSFTDSDVRDDATHKGVKNRTFAFDSSKFKLQIGNRNINSDFTRAASLQGSETAAYTREVGMKKQFANLQASLFKSNIPLTYGQQSMRDASGEFQSHEASLTGKSWSLNHIDEGSSKGFTRTNALQDSEIDHNLKGIAQMYGAGVAPQGNDRNVFLNANGLSRNYSSLTAKPFKDWDVKIEHLKLKNSADSAGSDTFAFASKNFQANFHRQQVGKLFLANTSLLSFEAARLGTMSGMDRSDFGMTMNLGRSRVLTVGTLNASNMKDSLTRTSISYKENGIDLQLNQRHVGAGFDNANQLVDPEKDLLQQIHSYRERDFRLGVQKLPNLKLDFSAMTALNETSGERRASDSGMFDWNPDKKTHVNYFHSQQSDQTLVGMLFAQSTERFSFSRSFGKFGNMELLDERLAYSGSTGTQPDAHKQYMSYEAKVTDTTSLKAERTHVSFENGTTEDTSANTLSTKLTKRMGVSVTDLKIDRAGEANDQVKRNYGVWYDFGNGMRLNWGYNRDLNGVNGTLNSTTTLGQTGGPISPDKLGTVQAGGIGDWAVGGGYGTNQWDSNRSGFDRTQAYNNLSLSTRKALKLGMFSDLQFKFNLDSATDYAKTLRENTLYAASGRLGTNQFAYEYRSQMDKNGFRGIDRSLRLQTDPKALRFLTGTMFYKLRTLPTNQQVMVRQFDVTAHLTKQLDLTNLVQTNPEVARGDVLLGSLPQASKTNKWKLDYKSTPNLTIGGTWDELINQATKSTTSVSGINMTFNQAKGSPVSVFFGSEEANVGTIRKTTMRYHIQFDKKASRNQTLSLFLGNVTYMYAAATGQAPNNWTARVDWQIKF